MESSNGGKCYERSRGVEVMGGGPVPCEAGSKPPEGFPRHTFYVCRCCNPRPPGPRRVLHSGVVLAQRALRRARRLARKAARA